MIDTGDRAAHNADMAGRMATKLGKMSRRFWLMSLLIGICGLWSLLSQTPVISGLRGQILLGRDGLLSFAEGPTIDLRYRVRGEIPSPLNLVYVDVDTGSLEAIGNFPWSRARFAQVADALFRFGRIRAIGFDFVFNTIGLPDLGREEAERGTLELARSIRSHRSIVLAASYTSGLNQKGRPLKFPLLFDRRTNVYDAELPDRPDFPVVGPGWGLIGLIDVVNDDVRNVPMFAPTRLQNYLAMSLQLTLLHYGLPPTAAEIGSDAIVIRGKKGEVARIPLWLGQLAEPNWFSPWLCGQNPRAGVATVLEWARAMTEGSAEEKHRAAEFFSEFNDAIVLVGPTDPLFKDTTPAPLSEGQVPRVSVHGNLLKTIVGGRYIQYPPWWVNTAIIFGLGLGVAALTMSGSRRLSRGRLLAVLLVAAYVVSAFALFSRFDLLVPLVAPLGSAFCCALVGITARLFAEEERRRRIKGLFGSYVSAAVVDEIVENDITPQTGGAEVEITAFFSDVASFTALSEQLSPSALVDLMCEYFAGGTKAITDAGGTLDKYVGDAIIAIFGAPLAMGDHAAAACRAALGLQEAQRALRAKWRSDGRDLPVEVLDMRTRIGLNTGRAVVGNIGSELRFNYTMMGAAVNLAQRLEAAASFYGAGILVSQATAEEALCHDGSFVFREIDNVAVAGQQEVVTAFELLAAEGAQAERARLYGEALKLYRGARWSEAGEVFMQAARLEENGARRNPCLVMAGRCESYALERREEPPSAFAVGKS